MVTAARFVEQARLGKYIGIPYSKLDCQGLVEKVLSDCGESHDWRGSNHMWREALSSKGKIEDPGAVPAGAWVFTVKNDGGEVERGYHDKEGNAAHVGIYIGSGQVLHSTKTTTANGVQLDVITSKRWTHFGLCRYIDYNTASTAADLRELVRQLSTYTLEDIIHAIRAL